MMLLSFQTHAKSVLKFRLWWWVESHMHFKGSITTLDHRLSQMSGEMGYAYICKRFLFYLSDLVISRRKIWEKPSLDSQIKRDLRVWVLWQGLYSQWERSTISRSLSLTYTVLSFSPSFFSHWKTILWKSCKKSVFFFFGPCPCLSYWRWEDRGGLDLRVLRSTALDASGLIKSLLKTQGIILLTSLCKGADPRWNKELGLPG